VGLEVGTSKVCAVVGEVLDDGNIMVVGVGQTNSEGVRKGEIVNIDATVECIHAAVADAEESAGVESTTFMPASAAVTFAVSITAGRWR